MVNFHMYLDTQNNVLCCEIEWRAGAAEGSTVKCEFWLRNREDAEAWLERIHMAKQKGSEIFFDDLMNNPGTGIHICLEADQVERLYWLAREAFGTVYNHELLPFSEAPS